MTRLKRFFEIPQAPRNWFWSVILFPFLVSRSIWVLIAYYASGNYLPNPSYLSNAKRGYFLTHIFSAGHFCRWDSRLVFLDSQERISAFREISETAYSNLAFFPLYPYLVKSVGWFGIPLPDSVYTFLGLCFRIFAFWHRRRCCIVWPFLLWALMKIARTVR